MPRDLHLAAALDGLPGTLQPEITQSPDPVEPSTDAVDSTGEAAIRQRLSSATRNSSRPRLDELHPYVQPLTVSDVDACTDLEAEAFPPQERATRQKVRLVLLHSAISVLSRPVPLAFSHVLARWGGGEHLSRCLLDATTADVALLVTAIDV